MARGISIIIDDIRYDAVRSKEKRMCKRCDLKRWCWENNFIQTCVTANSGGSFKRAEP